ncbi:MAG: hypothetical protein AAGG56_17865 [Pseudomonadota bacterium]
MTALIWRNSWGAKAVFGRRGHAALLLRGPSIENSEYYISWWPGESVTGLWDEFFKERAGQASDAYALDMANETGTRTVNALGSDTYRPRPTQFRTAQGWGTAADAVVNLPAIGMPGDRNQRFGLHLGHMVTLFEWEAWGGVYQQVSTTHSCAGMALRMLKVGGAEAFVSGPRNIVYTSPIDVEAYARKLQTAIRAFNGRVANFERVCRQELRSYINEKIAADPTWRPTPLTADLRPYETWRRESNIGAYYRSQKIRDIDSAVRSYHRMTNSSSGYADRFKKLKTIMVKIMDHRREKPNSARAVALNSLAMTVISAVQHSRTNYGRNRS